MDPLTDQFESSCCIDETHSPYLQWIEATLVEICNTSMKEMTATNTSTNTGPPTTTSLPTCKVIHNPYDTLCLFLNDLPHPWMHYIVGRSPVRLDAHSPSAIGLQNCTQHLTVEIIGIDDSQLDHFGSIVDYIEITALQHDMKQLGIAKPPHNNDNRDKSTTPPIPIVVWHVDTWKPTFMENIMLTYLGMELQPHGAASPVNLDPQLHYGANGTLTPIKHSALDKYARKCKQFIQDNVVVAMTTTTTTTMAMMTVARDTTIIVPNLKKKITLDGLAAWFIDYVVALPPPSLPPGDHEHPCNKSLWVIHVVLTSLQEKSSFFSSLVFKGTSVAIATPLGQDKCGVTQDHITHTLNCFTTLQLLVDSPQRKPFMDAFVAALATALVDALLMYLEFSPAKIAKCASYLTSKLRRDLQQGPWMPAV